MRVTQLEMLKYLTSECSRCMLCGDTNFRRDNEIEPLGTDKYGDAWDEWKAAERAQQKGEGKDGGEANEEADGSGGGGGGGGLMAQIAQAAKKHSGKEVRADHMTVGCCCLHAPCFYSSLHTVRIVATHLMLL